MYATMYMCPVYAYIVGERAFIYAYIVGARFILYAYIDFICVYSRRTNEFILYAYIVGEGMKRAPFVLLLYTHICRIRYYSPTTYAYMRIRFSYYIHIYAYIVEMEIGRGASPTIYAYIIYAHICVYMRIYFLRIYMRIYFLLLTHICVRSRRTRKKLTTETRRCCVVNYRPATYVV